MRQQQQQEVQHSNGFTQQSSSSSVQQQFYSSSSSTQQVTRVQQSSARQQQAQLGYSVGRSPSQASLKDSADGVLKDLETGLKQSTNYIQESRGPPAGAFDLEQEVCWATIC